MSNFGIQALSLVGAIALLAAFVAVQQGWWRPDGRPYLWLNLVGSSMLTAVAIWDRRAGFVLLEGVWAVVTFWSIVRRTASRE